MSNSRAAASSVTPSPAAAPDRVYRGVNHAQRTAERRQRLVDAAIACFGNHGFHRSTLKMLCAEAGLTERYFYESFANLEDALCCAYQYAAGAVFASVQEAVKKAAPDPVTRMEAGLSCYFKLIAADPARARLLLVTMEGVSDRARELERTKVKIFTELIRVETCGDLPDNPASGLSPMLLSSGVAGACYQLAKEWVMSNFKLPRSTIVKNALAIFKGSIAVWQPASNDTIPPSRKKPKAA